jgi:hypothetical protein
LVFRNADRMFASSIQALGIVLGIAMISGVIGGFYGRNVLAKKGVDWWLPNHLVHRTDFITVGSIHMFSYLGGIIGLVAGVLFLLIKHYRLRKRAGAEASATTEEASDGTGESL